MSKNLSTRDALLALRQFLSEDAESASVIKDLTKQLTDALDVRRQRLEDVLSNMENYVSFQSEIHGFNNDLENLVAATAKASRPRKKRATKKKATRKKRATKKKTRKKTKKKVSKKRKTNRKAKNGGPTKSLGFPGTLSLDGELSEKEQVFVDILVERWPVFTTPDFLVKKGVIPAPNHVTAKVNQLRNKGVPIQSARQARAADATIGAGASGYRLFGDD